MKNGLFFLLLSIWIQPICNGENIPDVPCPFIMDAVETGSGIYIATETSGVWQLRSVDVGWESVSQADFGSLSGDSYLCNHDDLIEKKAAAHVYAIAKDVSENIWAGSAHCGACVIGKSNTLLLSQKNGLSGERVYDIATSPQCTAVATNGGIDIYHYETQRWYTYNRAEGLPDDTAAAMAYDDKGQLWVAFACGGAGVLPKIGDKWQFWQAPWYFDSTTARQPFTATGSGLPGNLGTAIAVSGNVVYYGCTNGLAYKRGNGQWRYIRGADSIEKNKGLFRTPIPKNLPRQEQVGNLAEDYVTSIFPDGEYVWVGFRQKGVQKLHSDTMLPVADAAVNKFNKGARRALWVRSFLKCRDGRLYAATYGGGLRFLTQLQACDDTQELRPFAFPVVPTLPNEKNMESICRRLKAENKIEDAVYLYDDWLTRGDWCHRYGNHYALLCAAAAPSNVSVNFDVWKAKPVFIQSGIGLHHQKGDALRHWLDSHNDAANPNVLWNPEAGVRTESEWDDHGEEYAQSIDGPDIWVSVNVPPGKWMLSLYFYSPNGRKARNGYRDYLLEVRKLKSEKKDQQISELLTPGLYSLPVLARTRVYDFAGSGCWKNFALSHSGTYLVRICRNGSFNTILNGVFVSDLSKSPDKLHSERNLAIPLPPAPLKNTTTSGLPALPLRLWGVAHKKLLTNPALARRGLAYAYRAFSSAASVPPYLLERWRFLMRWFTPDEVADYHDSLLKSWYSVQATYPYARSSQWRPHSPRVVPLSPEELRYAASQGINWKQYLPHNKNQAQPSLKELRRQFKQQKLEK